MLRRFRFTRIVAAEPIIEVLTTPDVTAARLPAPQNINIKHTESRAVVAEEMVGVTGFEPAVRQLPDYERDLVAGAGFEPAAFRL
jgi:hypothetical protein